MAEPTPMQCGLGGLCPRCGAKGLFAGVIKFAPACGNCGLDFQAFNIGDGPAPFLIFGIGTLAVVAAIIFEFAAHPPWWLHALVWPPIVIGLTLIGLRIGKGALVAVEFRRGAGEGRLR